MRYGIARTLDADLDTAIERITASLKEQGFGVLTTSRSRAAARSASSTPGS